MNYVYMTMATLLLVLAITVSPVPPVSGETFDEPEPYTLLLPPIIEAPVVIQRETHESPLEKAVLDQAMLCAGANPKHLNRKLFQDMLGYEVEYGVPVQMRGMVLAAACHESKFDPGSEGDHKFSKRGKPLAIGILQQWPWWSNSPTGPKINRRNPREAARAWVAHVVSEIPKVRRGCHIYRANQVEKLWRIAWVTAVRAPSSVPRCRQYPLHWTLFQEWKATWQDQINAELSQES